MYKTNIGHPITTCPFCCRQRSIRTLSTATAYCFHSVVLRFSVPTTAHRRSTRLSKPSLLMRSDVALLSGNGHTLQMAVKHDDADGAGGHLQCDQPAKACHRVRASSHVTKPSEEEYRVETADQSVLTAVCCYRPARAAALSHLARVTLRKFIAGNLSHDAEVTRVNRLAGIVTRFCFSKNAATALGVDP